ncbi:MAG TPA: hypothetical protein VGB37_15450 [Candidatus Lokiarchaeia archaeon]
MKREYKKIFIEGFELSFKNDSAPRLVVLTHGYEMHYTSAGTNITDYYDKNRNHLAYNIRA